MGVRPVLACRRVLKPNGRYVAASVPKKMSKIFGRMLRMPLISLLGRKPVKLLSAASKKEDLVELAQMMERNEVRTVIDRTYGFDQLPDALRYQGEGHAQGKTVITVSSGESGE